MAGIQVKKQEDPKVDTIPGEGFSKTAQRCINNKQKLIAKQWALNYSVPTKS